MASQPNFARFVMCASVLPGIEGRAALQALRAKVDKLYTRERKGSAYIIVFDAGAPLSTAERAWVETVLALLNLSNHDEDVSLCDLMHSLEFMVESGPAKCLAVKERMLGLSRRQSLGLDSVEIVFDQGERKAVRLGKVVLVDAEDPSVVGSVMYVPRSKLEWRDVIGSPLL